MRSGSGPECTSVTRMSGVFITVCLRCSTTPSTSIWPATAKISRSRCTSTARSLSRMTGAASRWTCIRNSRCLQSSWFSRICMREESSTRAHTNIPVDCTGLGRSASTLFPNGLRLRFPGTGSSITWSSLRERRPPNSVSPENPKRPAPRSPSSRMRKSSKTRPNSSSTF